MIYTSRYQNPALKSGDYTAVGITRGAPKFKLGYSLSGNIIEIAPPGYLFQENDRQRFTPRYFRHMDRTGPAVIAKMLAFYEKLGKPVVLCCYEDVRNPEDWCHRLVFAEWWQARTGECIPELPDPSPNKWKPREPERTAHLTEAAPPEPEAEQLGFW